MSTGPGPMRHTNAIATPKGAPDAGLGAFTKEFRSRTGLRRVGERDRFSYPFKKTEVEQGKKTMEQAQHKVEQAAQQIQQRAEQAGGSDNK